MGFWDDFNKMALEKYPDDEALREAYLSGLERGRQYIISQDENTEVIRLNEEETKAWIEFQKEHKDCCQKKLHKPFFSTIGGGFSLIITPTGLGYGIIARCNSCKETKDITDTSNW